MSYLRFLALLGSLFSGTVLAFDNVSICRKNIDNAVKMTSDAMSLNSQCTDAVVKDLLKRVFWFSLIIFYVIHLASFLVLALSRFIDVLFC